MWYGICVIGGSYKSFYLNKLRKIGKPDIIVFNQNIFYDFDTEIERSLDGPVSTELIYLNQLFNCPIAVYSTRINNGKIDKCFILCNNSKIKIFEQNCEVYIKLKDGYVLLCNKRYFYSNVFATIIMQDRFNPLIFNPKSKNNCFYCTPKNVTLIKDGKFYKKFNKCCKFILHFFKKVV